jgi:DNA-directed RNA polymerase subunit RPC12/RpoP
METQREYMGDPMQHNIDEDLEMRDQVPRTTYVCGGCGKDVKLDKDAGIRCMHCGHRIFYKKRDRKLL